MAQRVGRGIALLFRDHGTIRGWVVSSTPRPHFTPGKDPVPILQEAGWTPGPVWTGGKSRHHRDSIPDRPARSQSLYRLSYRATYYSTRLNKLTIQRATEISDIWILLHSSSQITLWRAFQHKRLEIKKKYLSSYTAITLAQIHKKWTLNFIVFHNYFCTPFQLQRLRWSRGSVQAFSTQVRGLKPGRNRRIFRAKKSSARLPSEGN